SGRDCETIWADSRKRVIDQLLCRPPVHSATDKTEADGRQNIIDLPRLAEQTHEHDDNAGIAALLDSAQLANAQPEGMLTSRPDDRLGGAHQPSPSLGVRVGRPSNWISISAVTFCPRSREWLRLTR